MSKDDKSVDRSIKVGRDAAGSVIISGNENVLTIAGGNRLPSGQSNREVPTVFVSSTSDDLKPYRDAARDAANAAGFLPVQMEYFAASGARPPLQECLHKVSEVDVVVLIVAYRYGWVPDEQPPGEHKSITWLECEQARADKKEVLAFLVDEEQTWDEKLKEEYRITAALREGRATPELLAKVQQNLKRLADFKEWIDSIGVRTKFTTPEDLRGKVSDALREWKQRHLKSDKRTKEKKTARSFGAAKPPQPIFPATYREWLQRQCADVELLGVRLRQGQAVKLNHVWPV